MRKKEIEERKRELNEDIKEFRRKSQLEDRIKALEHEADVLEDKLFNIKNEYGELLVQYGAQVRKCVNREVDNRVDDIGMGILKKLIEGGLISFEDKKPEQ